VPAVVAAGILINCEVVAATRWADELSFFVARLQLVEVVENVKRHAGD
jgi:hypothetical protein